VRAPHPIQRAVRYLQLSGWPRRPLAHRQTQSFRVRRRCASGARGWPWALRVRGARCGAVCWVRCCSAVRGPPCPVPMWCALS
jgi:hypothetical protein